MKVLTWFSLLTAPLLPAEASRRQGVCVFLNLHFIYSTMARQGFASATGKKSNNFFVELRQCL